MLLTTVRNSLILILFQLSMVISMILFSYLIVSHMFVGIGWGDAGERRAGVNPGTTDGGPDVRRRQGEGTYSQQVLTNIHP